MVVLVRREIERADKSGLAEVKRSSLDEQILNVLEK